MRRHREIDNRSYNQLRPSVVDPITFAGATYPCLLPPWTSPSRTPMRHDFPHCASGRRPARPRLAPPDPPPGRVIYFYAWTTTAVRGVLPTRRLLLSPPRTPLTDVMVAKVVTLPAAATVLDACEFFIQHRLLAFPVVDADGRLLGVVDIDLYTNELARLDRATPVGRLVEPLVRFLRVESSGGIVLLACTVVALVLANSPIAGSLRVAEQNVPASRSATSR